MSLLREMALNLHFIAPLGELLLLINSDAEVDFFNNINHIQVCFHQNCYETIFLHLLKNNCQFCAYSFHKISVLLRLIEELEPWQDLRSYAVPTVSPRYFCMNAHTFFLIFLSIVKR